MKYKYILGSAMAVALMVSSCSLDYSPVSDYSDVTEGIQDTDPDATETEGLIFKNRADAESALLALYEDIRGNQNELQLDYLLIGDVHSDNAYAGTTGSEVVDPATNDLNSTTLCVNRDWKQYMNLAAHCTRFIVGVENVADGSLSQAEVNTMRAQAEIFRAFIWFRMVRMWGNIPLVKTVPPDITSDNIAEAYDEYFPAQNTEAEVYEAILADLEDALQYAPANNGDKTRFSKDVAIALLAKVYAEKPVRDYNKVIQYVDMLTAAGYALNPKYGDLFEVDMTPAAGNSVVGTPNTMNTPESILEVHYPVGSGNWASWMYGRCLEDYDYSFTWAKWITPSRDLLAAFNSVGDKDRLEQTVVYYSCDWSNYYPADDYAFMYKVRTGYANIYFLRYDDLLLLKAEALLHNGDLGGAAAIIDQIRARAGVKALTSSEKGNKDTLFSLYVNERRLELACEGERWFDLVRLDILEQTMEAAQRNDPGRLPLVAPYTVNSYLLPIPQDVLDTNDKVVQNPGY